MINRVGVLCKKKKFTHIFWGRLVQSRHIGRSELVKIFVYFAHSSLLWNPSLWKENNFLSFSFDLFAVMLDIILLLVTQMCSACSFALSKPVVYFQYVNHMFNYWFLQILKGGATVWFSNIYNLTVLIVCLQLCLHSIALYDSCWQHLVYLWGCEAVLL